MGVARNFVGVAFCLTATLTAAPTMAGASSATTRSPARAVRPMGSINVNDRATVISEFEAEFNRIEPPMQWTGNLATCTPGTTSTAYQQSILQRVNWLRRMAGVPDVVYSTNLNAQQQAGALISAAEGKLSHTPDASAKCWTQSGYNSTSSSNLYLGRSGASAMDGYVHDPGDNNAAAGHRMWVLHPGLQSITSGDIPPSSNNWSANALHVFDYVSQPQTQRDRFVTWPPKGYVPDDVVYPRWSVMDYGIGGATRANFTNATVTVTGPSGALAVNYQDRAVGGLVFIPAGFDTAPIQITTDATYTVSVSGLTGVTPTSFSYSFTMVPANTAPFENGSFSWGADKCATNNSNIGGPSVYDKESDAISVSLVAGEGDTDNSSFAIKNVSGSHTLVTAKDLDGKKMSYSVRYRATDVRGAFSERIFTFTLRDTATGSCPTTEISVVRRTVTGVIKRGTSRSISSFTARPPGTVTYATTGKCKLNASKKTVSAPTKKGNCTIVMTGTTTAKITITTLKLKVT